MDGSREELYPIKIMTWNVSGLEEVMQEEEAVSLLSDLSFTVLLFPSLISPGIDFLAVFRTSSTSSMPMSPTSSSYKTIGWLLRLISRWFVVLSPSSRLPSSRADLSSPLTELRLSFPKERL